MSSWLDWKKIINQINYEVKTITKLFKNITDDIYKQQYSDLAPV